MWGADDFSSIREVRKTRERNNRFRGVDGGLGVWSGCLGKAQQPRTRARLGWGMGRLDPGPAALCFHASPLPGLITSTGLLLRSPTLGAGSSARAEQGPEPGNIATKTATLFLV